MFRQSTFASIAPWMLLVCLCGAKVLAQNPEPAATAYDAVWAKLKEPLANRQYGAARDLLDNAAKSASLSGFQPVIAEDERDIGLLEELKKRVIQRCRGFQTGATVEVGSVAYEFIRFESDLTGDRLILKTLGNGRETERTLEQLPAKTWVALVISELGSTAENKYLIGVFHAVDKTGDRDEARKLLSAAAADGQQVSRWLERLAEKPEEARTPLTKAEKVQDPIVGTWRVVIGEGKREKAANVMFRPGGTTNLPGSKWLFDATTATYTVTLPHGGTAKVQLDPSQNGFRGRNAAGNPVRGVREADKSNQSRGK
ncbi:MAG: hypothetical protein HUU20_05985 [Pirellulales bacterium]|nr:hypothetical protein [Pirellulales bacterium]